MDLHERVSGVGGAVGHRQGMLSVHGVCSFHLRTLSANAGLCVHEAFHAKARQSSISFRPERRGASAARCSLLAAEIDTEREPGSVKIDPPSQISTSSALFIGISGGEGPALLAGSVETALSCRHLGEALVLGVECSEGALLLRVMKLFGV